MGVVSCVRRRPQKGPVLKGIERRSVSPDEKRVAEDGVFPTLHVRHVPRGERTDGGLIQHVAVGQLQKSVEVVQDHGFRHLIVSEKKPAHMRFLSFPSDWSRAY